MYSVYLHIVVPAGGWKKEIYIRIEKFISCTYFLNFWKWNNWSCLLTITC